MPPTVEAGGFFGPAEGFSPHAPKSFLPGRAPLPSRNDRATGANIVVWMEEKAAADRERVPGLTPALWCVRGELYDLSAFAPLHPGGASWITSTRGMDVTEWFETHHIDIAKAERLLARYRVGACEGPYRPIFTFAEGGFYASLRRRVLELHRRTEGGLSGPAPETQLAAGLCVAGWAAAFSAMARASPGRGGGARGSYALSVPAGALMYCLFSLGHNFFHQRDSRWRHVFDLTMMSSRRWRLSHALAHHPFSNLEIDPEASATELPGLVFMRSRPTNHPVVYLRWALVNTLIAPATLLGAAAEAAAGRERVELSDLAPALQVAAAALASGTLRRGAGLTLAMHAVASWLLIIFSTPVHRSDHSWTEGCGDPATDYGEHIVKSTQEYATDAGLPARVLFGFSDHVIHHLFPTVDLAKQRLIRPLLDEELRRHGVPARRVGFPRLLSGTLAALVRKPADLFYTPPPARL